MKIKLCFISTLTRLAGVETILLEHLRNVKSRIFKYHVIATSIEIDVAESFKELEIPIFVPERRFKYDPNSFLQMANWLKKNEIDIVHTFNLESNCWGGIAASIAHVPLRVAGEHGTIWLPTSPLTVLESFFIRTANLVVANSFASKTMLMTGKGIAANKIEVVHNSVEFIRKGREEIVPQLRKDLDIDAKSRVVGTVGRLSASKDLFTWLKTSKILADKYSDIRFLVVGDGPLKDELKRYAKGLGLEKQVRFTGWRRDARDLIALFDVYLSSSIHESFGNTLVEAAYHRKPVVAPNVDGIPEVVVNGKTGFLVTPDAEVPNELRRKNVCLVPRTLVDGIPKRTRSADPFKLARKVGYLLENPQIREQFGEAACKRAKKNFSTDRYVADLERLYLSIYRNWKSNAKAL